jgi:hypothetical protein
MVEDADLWRWALPDSRAFHAGLSARKLEYSSSANPGIWEELLALDAQAVIEEVSCQWCMCASCPTPACRRKRKAHGMLRHYCDSYENSYEEMLALESLAEAIPGVWGVYINVNLPTRLLDC